MSFLTRIIEKNVHRALSRSLSSNKSTGITNTSSSSDDDEFRVLNLRAVKQTLTKRRERVRDQSLPPRCLQMATDQDWTAVWPGPRSFHPATVPLPLRQGWTEKSAPAPGKFYNAELMKIPNFLHLTPQAIKKQCEALKKFCTPWPQSLKSESDWSKLFPIKVSHADYCHALPTIRNVEARRVTVCLQLSALKFDVHSYDKFLRLVGERYDSKTDTLKIVADRCPLRKQNYDYALYLMTACYHESFITEPWEASKSEPDMECYKFECNKSKKSATEILNWKNKISGDSISPSQQFAESVELLINEGENENNLKNYKTEVLRLLQLSAH